MVWFRPGGERTAQQLTELFEKLFLEGALPHTAADAICRPEVPLA